WDRVGSLVHDHMIARGEEELRFTVRAVFFRGFMANLRGWSSSVLSPSIRDGRPGLPNLTSTPGRSPRSVVALSRIASGILDRAHLAVQLGEYRTLRRPLGHDDVVGGSRPHAVAEARPPPAGAQLPAAVIGVVVLHPIQGIGRPLPMAIRTRIPS